MSDQLTGKRVAFLVAGEGIEQVELTRPWDAVRTDPAAVVAAIAARPASGATPG